MLRLAAYARLKIVSGGSFQLLLVSIIIMILANYSLVVAILLMLGRFLFSEELHDVGLMRMLAGRSDAVTTAITAVLDGAMWNDDGVGSFMRALIEARGDGRTCFFIPASDCQVVVRVGGGCG